MIASQSTRRLGSGWALVTAAVAMLLPAGVLHAQGAARAVRNLEYAQAGGVTLKLDLYLPTDAKAGGAEQGGQPAAQGQGHPLIVWIHGGAWWAGSKNFCPALWMVRRGYAVASVEYRLSLVAPFPAQIYDCKAAIRWLRANAAKYHLDPDRVGVWGASAGGHLVALLGTAGGKDGKPIEGDEGDDAQRRQSSRVQAVCDFFGPTDLVQLARAGVGNLDEKKSPITQLLGGPISDKADLAKAANPITYVSKDDPPFLIMHGDKDPLVPLSQSQLLQKALTSAGVKSTLHVVEGAGHGFGGEKIKEMVEQFFDQYLMNAKPQP